MEELIDVPQHYLEKAFATARKECRFFPRPAEILEFVKRERNKIQILFEPGTPEREEQERARDEWPPRKLKGAN